MNHIKKLILKRLTLFLLVALTQIANSQTHDKMFALSVGLIRNEYNGDYGSEIFDFKEKNYNGIGFNLNYYLSPSINLGIQSSNGSFGYYADNVNAFSCNKFDAAFTAQYKLANGHILNKDSKLNPYFSAGLGFADYRKSNKATPWPTFISNGIDIILPLGLGLKYQISDAFALQYQYLYTLTSSDVHDQNRSGGIVNDIFGTPAHPGIKAGNDAYGQHFFSLIFCFSKPWDKNNDQILDSFQKIE